MCDKSQKDHLFQLDRFPAEKKKINKIKFAPIAFYCFSALPDNNFLYLSVPRNELSAARPACQCPFQTQP